MLRSQLLKEHVIKDKSSGTESEVQDESNGSGNDTYADDADIRPVYDEEPMDEVKHDIDVTETINIKLEHNVAKLLTENEHLNMEKEHSKKTYKDLYDSIKKTRVQTKDHNDSLTEQLNKKSIENADSKAQIQEKVFAIAALKNKLRKLKGNSVDTKFAKPSILGKPSLQTNRKHPVVPTGKIFTSCTSKADSEHTHGSCLDISKIHECKQTLDLSAEVPATDMIVMTSMTELECLFDPLFDEYFNGENQVVSKSFAVTTADASDKRQQ
ncbi:hypothetical protein Tco_1525242 [Tanacetum coccineum]